MDANKEIIKRLDHYARKFKLLTQDEEQVLLKAFLLPRDALMIKLAKKPANKGLDERDLRDLAKHTLITKGTTEYNKEAAEARDKLFRHNVRLIKTYTKNAKKGTLEQYDLFIAGYEGLDHAIDKFDLTRRHPRTNKPLKFSTYAVWWIRQYIQRSIQDYGRIIRIPIHVHDQINKLRTIYYDLASQNYDRQAPDSEELTEAYNAQCIAKGKPKDCLKIEDVRRLGSYLHNIESLDEELHSDETTTLTDNLSASRDSEPDYYLEENSDKQKLLDLLEQLGLEDSKFMQLKWGLFDGIERSPRELCSVLGMKLKDIIAWEESCLEKLRRLGNAREFNY